MIHLDQLDNPNKEIVMEQNQWILKQLLAINIGESFKNHHTQLIALQKHIYI